MKLSKDYLKKLIKEELSNVLGEEYEKPDPIKSLYSALQKATQEDQLAHMNLKKARLYQQPNKLWKR